MIMKRFEKIILHLIGVIILCLSVSMAESDDAGWPQFHGPRRDNVSDETGLLKSWPEEGPELIYKTEGIGHGFSSVAISDGIIYTAGNIDNVTYITAMDMSGKIIWQSENGPAFTRSYPGARGTPTIVGDKLYHLNGNGYLVCLKSKTGERIWSLNILEKFNGRNIEWGLSESVLVDGQNVICCPGGEEISMVALDRNTGETRWTCTGVGDKPGYSSPIFVDYDGLGQIVAFTSASLIGVGADTGKLLWKYDHPIQYDVNIVMPIYHEGHIIIFATLNRGGTMLRPDVQGDFCSVEEVWRTYELDNEHGGVVLIDGYFYGHADGDHKWRHWACLKLETGETMYSVDGLPVDRSAAITYADGMLYVITDKGIVALVPATPDGFEPVSQFELPKGGEGPTWAHPVVYNKRLYIRHSDLLYVYDIGQ